MSSNKVQEIPVINDEQLEKINKLLQLVASPALQNLLSNDSLLLPKNDNVVSHTQYSDNNPKSDATPDTKNVIHKKNNDKVQQFNTSFPLSLPPIGSTSKIETGFSNPEINMDYNDEKVELKGANEAMDLDDNGEREGNFKEFDFTIGAPLDPPPTKKFPSLELLKEFVHTWAKTHGYTLSIKSSKLGRNVYLACERRGLSRQGASIKCNCPFIVAGNKPIGRSKHEKVWTLTTKVGHHNHAPDDDFNDPIHERGIETPDNIVPSMDELTEALVDTEQAELDKAQAKFLKALEKYPVKIRTRMLIQWTNSMENESVEHHSKSLKRQRPEKEEPSVKRVKCAGIFGDEETTNTPSSSSFEDESLDLSSNEDGEGNEVEFSNEKMISEKKNLSKYYDQLLEGFDQFITGIFDPPGDGNCGFSAIAKALNGGEKYFGKYGWVAVRNDLIGELEAHETYYKRMFDDDFHQIRKNLKVSGIKSFVGKSQWLSGLDHGPLIANCYKRPFCIIGSQPSLCSTFLPHFSFPDSVVEPIYLAHVDGCHWVLLFVKEYDGLKPIPKVVLLSKNPTEEDQAWQGVVANGLGLFNRFLKGKLNL